MKNPQQQLKIKIAELEKELAVKNRELEIEGSLERVRAQAMGMTKPKDLLSVCEKLFTELQTLGFNKLRNAIIHILNDEKGFFLDYDYSDFTGGSITTTFYNSHPILLNFLKQIKSANDAFAEVIIDGSQLSDWKEFRKKSGQPDDSRLDNIPALYYYFYSIGLGDVGISTFSPIDDNQVEILKRFRNVFELAYRRFMDIQRAESQAKEAKIEASLEKVRASAMAMHNSSDLSATASLVFTQLRKLGINPIRAGVCLLSKDSRKAQIYTTTTSSESDILSLAGSLDMSAHSCFEMQYKSWMKNENYFPVLSAQELKSYYEVLSIQLSVPALSYEQFELEEYGYYLSFSEGLFYAWSNHQYSESEINILNRFKGIIDLTFRRYLDLKKAEIQSREALIEVALERVRSKTMAMHKSDELAETAAVVFKQLIGLGIAPNRLYIGIIIDESGKIEFWITDEDGTKVSKQFTGNINRNDSIRKMHDAWKEQKKSITIDMQGRELEDYFHYLNEELNVPFTFGLKQKRRVQSIAYFSKGFIGIASPGEQPEETINLLERFAGVFNLTYTRFFDLKNAETQNKIIQAENERKTKELEEARQLQLSMLPKKLPQIPHLQLAAHMRTATEVGGDYYDFIVQENGVLNIGFGDATGHGLQAGTMITLMKGFFTSDAAKLEPQNFLEHCSNMIREIKLGRILMSFSLLRIFDSKLLISSAGMPPIFYYNKSERKTEEILIPGIPLGAMQKSSYKLVERKLRIGDTLLLLTDGFPEQTNSNDEMFNYCRVKNHFNEIADKSPDEIINSLVKSADDWMNGKPQEDDITFIVIKVV